MSENGTPGQEQTAEQALDNKLNAVNQAIEGSKGGSDIPTGNDVEKAVLKDLEQQPAAAGGRRGVKPGQTRGNYQKYTKPKEEAAKEKEQEEQEQEQEEEVEVDTLTPKLSAVALMATNIPFLQNKFGKKDPKAVMFTPDQEEQLRKMLPPSAFGKKTMFDYWMTATSMLIVNFMQAPVIKEEKPPGNEKNLSEYIENMSPQMRQMFKEELSKHP